MRKAAGLKKVENPASHLSRRETVKLLGMVPLGLALAWTPSPTQVERFLRISLGPRPSALDLKFFTSEEYQTVRLLADLIIPRDERSGSASDAGVPEFMDFMMADRDTSAEVRTAMRGGLAWTDAECGRRYGKRFMDCSERERIGLLDEIAWPARARPEMSDGVAFFNAFRDLTASGFWSSEMGVKDLRYQGNAVVPKWTGCPDAALRKIGVRYQDG
ncbi:MAG TPA: gluconate 2-dehydrogenase subunit 3 family protein [Gemmatimonadales bacterium]|nr:gluconate 2-dehydrogenase subunit 3 family protein [Gemmatimonadales bacterium]